MTILINAQWQGSGRGERYPIGAERLKRIVAGEDVIIPPISYRATSRHVEQGVFNSDVVHANFAELEAIFANGRRRPRSSISVATAAARLCPSPISTKSTPASSRSCGSMPILI